MAEIIETSTPKRKVSANPCMSGVPNQKRIRAVIILEELESRIESHARENPFFVDSAIVRPPLNSSLIRSKIRTFASTAIPIDIINPAIPAAVRVTGINLNNASIVAT